MDMAWAFWQANGGAVIVGLLSVLCSLWIYGLGRRVDYKNEYYKAVVARRMDAYEKAEVLATSLLTTLYDSLSIPVAASFSSREALISFEEKLREAAAVKLWISADMEGEIEKLSQIHDAFLSRLGEEGKKRAARLDTEHLSEEELQKIREDQEVYMVTERAFHKDITACRDAMLDLIRRDIRGLSDVDAFLSEARKKK